jgi:hypothetical protein
MKKLRRLKCHRSFLLLENTLLNEQKLLMLALTCKLTLAEANTDEAGKHIAENGILSST